MSLALVTCYFNPMGYARPLANYWRFRHGIGPHPLTTIELSFSGTFTIPDSIKINGDPQHQVLWQKERLLNYAIEQLPESADCVAWLDSDLLFCNQNWIADTERLLKRFPVVQLFEGCHWLDSGGHVIRSSPSAASAGRYFESGHPKPHPGFGWAARREVLDSWGGLFDCDIMGSGDTWMTHAFFQETKHALLKHSSSGLRQKAADWSTRVGQELGPTRVAAVPGDVLHFYHGDLTNRNYWPRVKLLHELGFNPECDIEVAANGAWQWSSPKPALHARVRDYFAMRREDD